jgi:hypothetical protein
MTKSIIPRYKLMLFYDPVPALSDRYYQFVMNEMVPTAQNGGLYMFRVFHTAWGTDQPVRQAEFVAEDLDSIRALLDSDEWRTLEEKMAQYCTNYHRKVVKFRPGFQL